MSWRHFKREHFACKHCGENKIADSLIDALDELRERCGFPLVVSSGYRCPEHNKNVSSTGANGPHTTGLAADLAVDRWRAFTLLRHAMAMPVFTGIGVNQKGGGRFIHLDTLTEGRPTIWSY